MPEPNWSYTGWWGGTTPSTKLLPQSDFFNQVNADLRNNPAMSAAQLGELWRARPQFTPAVSPGQPVAPALPTAAFPTLSNLMPRTPASSNANVASDVIDVEHFPVMPDIESVAPTKSEVTQAIDLSNLVNQYIRDYYEKANPGSAATDIQLGKNIDAAAHGMLPEDVLRNIGRQGAEYGVLTGAVGSPSANAAMLRALGLTSLQRQDEAEKLRTSQMGRTPQPTDVTKFLTPTDAKVSLAVETFRAQNNRFTEDQKNDLQRELERSRREGIQISDDAKNQLALILKQMELTGEDKNRANQLLIAELNNAAGNYRTAVGAQAGLTEAQIRAQAERDSAALRYNQNQGFSLANLLGGGGGGGYGGGGSYGSTGGPQRPSFPTFDEVFQPTGGDYEGGATNEFGQLIDEFGFPV